MSVTFTQDQRAAIDVRDASVLVSAAAGSGKTAVLVERIIALVSDESRPLDIDRLLVVTFTNAAAAQMRERITQALSRAVEENPSSEHLVRQLTLVHNAQITTIDSFCLYLIRNHFDEIGLDPDFRVADEGEVRLLERDVLEKMLEAYFAQGSREFLDCVEYFAPAGNEKRLEEQILGLYNFVMSHPWPEEWLERHKRDYDVTADSLEGCDWVAVLKEYVHTMVREAGRILDQALVLSEEPDGPYMYLDALEEEAAYLKCLSDADTLEELYLQFSQSPSVRLSSKKDEKVSAAKRERAKALRKEAKDILTKLREKYFQTSPAEQAGRMAACAPRVSMLLSLVGDYCVKVAEKKREKNLLDFSDMEHMALAILTERVEGDVRPSRTSLELREHYAQIMIDEYQDSNLVQEYLLYSVSGEEAGRYNRFMVGDVKQSIYKFRLARPELFMEKFARYKRKEDVGRNKTDRMRERRIDLKQNFRSRIQVTDSVNEVFSRIMGEDLGGVAYDEDAALYPGASFPELERPDQDGIAGLSSLDSVGPNTLSEGPGQGGSANGACGARRKRNRRDVYETELLLTVDGEDGMEDREREALAVAGKIRETVGKLPVTDQATGALRPARYGDIVLLLRTTAGWDEVFKRVLEECGIPVYITSRTGYFAAAEVQTILNFLKVLNNPLQDIPLFGVLLSPVAGFTDQEIAALRAGRGKEKLYYSLKAYGQEGEEPVLLRKCRRFLDWFTHFRDYVAYLPIHRLIGQFLEETGYLYTVSALPGGEQRRANVEMLVAKAEKYEQTSYFGLFHFLQYMDQVEKYEIDYGEASLQDENADTVRIMSIHKSKGLEFPVCFVCGLSKRFNLQDTAKPVIVDMDYGIGLDYVDISSRIKAGTLKKSVLALKLQRDSLGEELRVLYVAMTRAKEKLILVGNCKEAVKEKVQKGEEEETSDQTRQELLPFCVRISASCYLDWLLPAWLDCGRTVTWQDASVLLAGRMKEEQGRGLLRARLSELAKEEELLGRRGEVGEAEKREAKKREGEAKEKEEDREGEEREEGGEEREEGGEEKEREEPACQTDDARDPIRRLQERMESVYPHEILGRLYTKTTVSELKKAGMEETAEEAYRLFSEEEPIPYLPRFIREKETQDSDTHLAAREDRLRSGCQPFCNRGFCPDEADREMITEGKMGGAARGSAYHKVLELFDFKGRTRILSDKQTGEILDSMVGHGLEKGYREAVRPDKITRFLKSGLAERMERAAQAGRLFKEQPFVLGLSASEMDPAFPETETVLIQGIIDVFFEEEDGLVVADYKTDRVEDAGELLNRYRVQLEYYARALTQITGKFVKEKIIYSFALQQEIPV